LGRRPGALGRRPPGKRVSCSKDDCLPSSLGGGNGDLQGLREVFLCAFAVAGVAVRLGEQGADQSDSAFHPPWRLANPGETGKRPHLRHVGPRLLEGRVELRRALVRDHALARVPERILAQPDKIPRDRISRLHVQCLRGRCRSADTPRPPQTCICPSGRGLSRASLECGFLAAARRGEGRIYSCVIPMERLLS